MYRVSRQLLRLDANSLCIRTTVGKNPICERKGQGRDCSVTSSEVVNRDCPYVSADDSGGGLLTWVQGHAPGAMAPASGDTMCRSDAATAVARRPGPTRRA